MAFGAQCMHTNRKQGYAASKLTRCSRRCGEYELLWPSNQIMHQLVSPLRVHHSAPVVVSEEVHGVSVAQGSVLTEERVQRVYP